MATTTRGVILVGHGGIPKGCPSELVTKLKRLEGQRRAAGMPMSAEEHELDTKVRKWPRTPETDPYQSGLEAVAAQLRVNLGDVLFAVATTSSVRRRWKSRWRNWSRRVRSTLPSPRQCLRRGVLIPRWKFQKSSTICGRSIPGLNSATPGHSTSSLSRIR